MSKNFSSIIQVNDLNDFIGPGLECIKPVETTKNLKSSNKISISIDSENKASSSVSNQTVKKVDKAKISLDDCLACSGCVTSAETVLINQQSVGELLKVIESNSKLEGPLSKDFKLICVSISPQSLTSLAFKYGMDLANCAKRLCTFFKEHLNAQFVFDASFSAEFSIKESQKEFLERFNSSNSKLPILTSVCPGWICYAEKTHGFILPYISTVKSPQQVIGSSIKDYIRKKMGDQVNPNNIFHVCIMPCFDKKLEASRKEFQNEAYKSKDVDCVLSTVEIEELLEKENIDLGSLNDGVFDKPVVAFESSEPSPFNRIKLDKQEEFYSREGGGSEGYAEAILIHAAKELFNVDLRFADIKYKQLKNLDFREVYFEMPDGEVKLRFAKAYGFRNIQSIVQKIKKNNCPYQYVEIMACPLGCLNGGGQIRDKMTNTLNKELFEKLDSLYNSVINHNADYRAETNSLIEKMYDEWLGKDAKAIDKHLHTSYNVIEKMNNNLMIKW